MLRVTNVLQDEFVELFSRHFSKFKNQVSDMLKNNELGIDLVNSQTYTGSTALARSCFYNDFDTAALLIKHHADVNLATTIGNLTPLHIACIHGNVEITQLLVENGANPYIVETQNIRNAFHNACMANSIPILQVLLNNYPVIQFHPDKYDYTPMSYAVKHNNMDMINLLIEHNVYVLYFETIEKASLHCNDLNMFKKIVSRCMIELQYKEVVEARKRLKCVLYLKLRKNLPNGIIQTLFTQTCLIHDAALVLAYELQHNTSVSKLCFIGLKDVRYMLAELILEDLNSHLEFFLYQIQKNPNDYDGTTQKANVDFLCNFNNVRKVLFDELNK